MTDVQETALEGFTTFDIASDAVGDTFRITVATPFLYDTLQDKLPTLYLLDGFLTLPMASSIARSLEVNAFGVMKSVICVGISYATDNPIDIFTLRTRDMTPTESELPPSPMPIDSKGMGGASKFLDSLTNEIIPVVEERFRADPSDRCLVGWSLGGLFGLYTLFNRPEAFAKYLLVSPSIWWNEQTILKDEAAYAGSHDDLAATVFACVGEREETAPSRMWPQLPSPEYAQYAMDCRMVSSLQDLVTTLQGRRYPNLDLTSHVFEDEHHVTVGPAAFARGIHSFYS